LLVEINRDKAQRYGLSTLVIASTIRTALFGKEISDFKVGEDEFPIQIRLAEKYRENLSSLMNQKISFMNPATRQLNQIPISAVADFTYSTTYPVGGSGHVPVRGPDPRQPDPETELAHRINTILPVILLSPAINR